VHHSAVIDTLQIKLQMQEAAIANLTSQLTSLRVTVSSQFDSIGLLNTQLTSVAATVKLHSDSISVFSSFDAAQEVAALNATLVSHTTLLSGLSTSVASTETTVASYNSLISGFQTTLNQQSVVLSAITSVNSSNLAGTVAQLFVSDQAHTTQIAALEASDANRVASISSLSSDISTLTSRVSAVEGTSEQTHSRLSTVETNVTVLALRVSTNEGFATSTSARVSALENMTPIGSAPPLFIFLQTLNFSAEASLMQLAGLQAANSSTAAWILSVENAVSSATSRLGGLDSYATAGVNTLQLQMQLLNHTQAAQSVQISALQSANVSVQSTAVVLNQRVTALEGNTAAASVRLSAVEFQSASSSVGVAQLLIANSSVEQSITQLGSTVAAFTSQVISLQAAQILQITALQAVNASVQAQSAALGQRLGSLEQNFSSLTTRLSAAESLSGSSALVRIVAQLQVANSSVQLVQQQLSGLLSSQAAQTGALQSSIAAQSSQIQALQASNASLQLAIGGLSLRVASDESTVLLLTARLNASETLIAGSSLLVDAVKSLQAFAASNLAIYSVSVVAGSKSAAVSWSLNSFTAISSPGDLQCTSVGGSSCTINGLTNGVAYRFNVTGRNIAGIGPTYLYSNAVVPALACVPVTVQTNGQGYVSVVGSSTECGVSFPVGSTVTLTAVPTAGYAFSSPTFTGTLPSMTNPFTFGMPTFAVTLTVNFVCISLTYSVNDPVLGSVVVSPKNSAGCPTNFYIAGSSVTLTASAVQNYTLQSVTGTLNSYATNPFTFNMPSNPVALLATFSTYQHKATVVYGQNDFTSNSANYGILTPTATSMSAPTALIVDPAGNLYGTFSLRGLPVFATL
jgi:hypothetical protein